MAEALRAAYRPAPGWPRTFPAAFEPFCDVPAVAVDSRDRVYIFNRAASPVLIFDREGRFVSSWGEGIFTNPHGITIGPDDAVYCVDHRDHTVRKFSPSGELLLTIGHPGEPSDTGCERDAGYVPRSAGPFNGCANVALAGNGDIYVADGYRNARVHQFDAAGRLLRSWGEPGKGPGQFRLPHGIAIDQAGLVYVCDRTNNRVQIFTPEGAYLREWTNVSRPCQIVITAEGTAYVAEVGLSLGARPDDEIVVPEGRSAASQITLLDLDGNVLERWGNHGDPCAPGNVRAPHGIAVDSRRDVYVVEVDGFAKREGVTHDHFVQKFVH